MRVRLNYTYSGFVPKKKGLYFCIYLDPSGNPTFGLARAEWNIITEAWEWNNELGKPFGGSPPFAYLEATGDPTTLVAELQKNGSVELYADCDVDREE